MKIYAGIIDVVEWKELSDTMQMMSSFHAR